MSIADEPPLLQSGRINYWDTRRWVSPRRRALRERAGAEVEDFRAMVARSTGPASK